MFYLKQTTRGKHGEQGGFTLFVAMVVMGTLLVISMGIVNLAVKQGFISSAGRESQYAFYAADTGIECALYWDVKNPSGYSAFATSTGSFINCNEDSANSVNPIAAFGESEPVLVGSSDQSVFTITFQPDPYCAVVTVTKGGDGSTVIESRGYNSCDSSNARRVERAVRVKY